MLSPHFWDGISGMFCFVGLQPHHAPCKVEEMMSSLESEAAILARCHQGGAESKFKAFILQ